ncbi:MAG: diguanylate cyclase [Planctomycetes bacterium]|nr:diguanylate cyclase [Planctomycetota bacterium]
MRILIAEDDRASRRLLEVTLTKWGHEVISTCNGAEALAILHGDNPPKLAILDWMMPDIDGLTVARDARNLNADSYVYIILLTAKATRADMLEGMEAGADDYLIKPLDIKELEVRLQAAQRIINLQNELIAARESLREQATRDLLTKLWNRGAIMDVLSAEIARAHREDTCVGVIMGDLDHFKKVNDTHGHKAGDIVLAEVAHRLRNVLRPYDNVGRYGGEEFLMVVPRCDTTFAAYVGERTRAAIASKPFVLPDCRISVTMSLGIASMRGINDPHGDLLVQAADEALYRAKRAGRNRVEVVQPLVCEAATLK